MSTKHLIIHEVMGRNCGWLTAQTAFDYRDRMKNREFIPELLIDQSRWDIDAVYIPESDFDFQTEVSRLKAVMDAKDGVNVFLSEGAGLETIVREMEGRGQEIPRDAFGHVRLHETVKATYAFRLVEEHCDIDRLFLNLGLPSRNTKHC